MKLIAFAFVTTAVAAIGSAASAQPGVGSGNLAATVATSARPPAIEVRHKRSRHMTMGRGASGGPNGSAGGPTSLSGTGLSQYGGTGTPGAANGR